MFKIYLKLTLTRMAYLLFRSKHFSNLKEKYKRQLRIYRPQFKNDGRKNVLIVGRLRHWDSLAKHTEFFLNAVDFNNIRLYLYNEEEHQLYQYYTRTRREAVTDLSISHLDCSCFDLMIYTSPLTHNCLTTLEWKNEKYLLSAFPRKKAKLNVAYSVWDGTVAHPKWVEIINSYFDAVFVPQPHMCNYLADSGVTKPVFPLLNAFDYKEFINSDRHPLNKPFVFGINATFEKRKNVYKVAESFIKAFGHQKGVKLHIHMRYMSEGQDNPQVVSFMKMIKPYKNIVFDNTCLSVEDNKKLMKSYDAYVFPSMAEGYSVTPREALACGHVLILSDIKTHQTITDLKEDSGVFWLKADRAVPIHQLDLPLGSMFDIRERDLINAFQYVYQHRQRLLSDDLVQKRKKAALRFDLTATNKFFQVVLAPHNVVLKSDNRITDTEIQTNSLSLLEKYKKYMHHKKAFIVCPCLDAGFFSNFNKYVSHLCHAADDAVVIPDWRVKTLQADVLKRTRKKIFESWCYGTKEDGNVFLKFFQNPYPKELSDKILQTDEMYKIASEKLDSFDFNAQKEPFLTYINSYNLYNDEQYFPVFRERYHKILQKHIHLQPYLQKKIESFYNANLKGHLVVAAFIRCKGHATELLEESPTFSLWEKKLLEILKEEKIEVSSNKWKFFIATDNEDSLLYFSKKYPQNIVFQKMQRLTPEQEQEYAQAKKKHGRDLAGYELQHRKAANEASHSLRNGEEVIFDVYLAASADYLIFTNSNMSTAASYINPKLKMVYCKERAEC